MHRDVVVSNAVFTIANASYFTFGVLTSSVHMAWMRAVCGRLKSDYRYSNKIVYNTFIWPNPTDAQRDKIERTAKTILESRAMSPNSSLADLYDETTMPPELIKAHRENDRAVMKAYGFKPSMTEAEIVAELLKRYQARVEELEKEEAEAKAKAKAEKQAEKERKKAERQAERERQKAARAAERAKERERKKAERLAAKEAAKARKC